MLSHLYTKLKCVPKKRQIRVNTRYEIKLFEFFAVQFDNGVVLEQLNPSYYVKTKESKRKKTEKKL